MAQITRYDPWNMLTQLHNEIDSLFENRMTTRGESQTSASDWVPAVDIKEEDDGFVIHADIPGVNPDDIHVSMDNGVLSISGERKHEASESKQGFKRVERVQGNFYRRFSLPDNVDAEKISAKSMHGVLEVRIPKAEKVQSRRISVES